MDITVVVLRFVHVVGGIFWVGAVLFTVGYLMRALADVGPAGGQVMAALAKRRWFDVLPGVAILVVLSGVDLLRRVSGGFAPQYMGSGVGIALSIGGLCGILALLIGLIVSRPATLRAMALMAQASAVTDTSEKQGLMAHAMTQRSRGQQSMRIVAVLLFVTATCMAIARYL